MQNLSRSVALEKEGWQDRPSTCLTSAELWFAENGSWVITSGLALIFFAMINARRISKIASEWVPRLALSHRCHRKPSPSPNPNLNPNPITKPNPNQVGAQAAPRVAAPTA